MRRQCVPYITFLLIAGILSAMTLHSASAQVRLETPIVPSKSLQGNPLNDPSNRKIAVFLPPQYDNAAVLPVVYYLPGFGGSPDDAIRDADIWKNSVQNLVDAAAPVVIVVIDGRTRWSCSQYINSPAQGKYADYIAKDVVAFVESHYRVAHGPANRIIAGHSSGGFGALRLGYAYPKIFGHVVALAPDCDFNISQLPLVSGDDAKLYPLDKVRALTPIQSGPTYAMALAAAYSPLGKKHPGQVDWLYDAQHQFRPTVWRRWMANDPLEIVRKHHAAFKHTRNVYLDGGVHDEFHANIGAQKIANVLQGRSVRSFFYEAPGGHMDFLMDRIERGVTWALRN
ncbi:esterase [Capsulimonas corticalis]|uniref:Esterase n=2 Tax=Capsulimonas corticalis TaxID=2219043 RepID=A0A9N7QCW6_9BACT|nr:esterase [Capsulimonas corticalis]